VGAWSAASSSATSPTAVSKSQAQVHAHALGRSAGSSRSYKKHLTGRAAPSSQHRPDIPPRFVAAAAQVHSPRGESQPRSGRLVARNTAAKSSATQPPAVLDARVEEYALSVRAQQVQHSKRHRSPATQAGSSPRSSPIRREASPTAPVLLASTAPGSTVPGVVVSSPSRSRSGSRATSPSPSSPSRSRPQSRTRSRSHSPMPLEPEVAEMARSAQPGAAPASAWQQQASPRSLGVGNNRSDASAFAASAYAAAAATQRRFVSRRHTVALDALQSPSALILFDEQFFESAHARAVEDAARVAAAAGATVVTASTAATPFPPSTAAPSHSRSRAVSRRASRSASRAALDEEKEEDEEATEEGLGASTMRRRSGALRHSNSTSPSRGDSPSRRAAAAAAVAGPSLAVSGRSTTPGFDEHLISAGLDGLLPTHVSERSYEAPGRSGAGTIPVPRSRTVRTPASFAPPLQPLPLPLPAEQQLPAGSQSARHGAAPPSSSGFSRRATALSSGSQTARSTGGGSTLPLRPHTSWQPTRPTTQASATASTSSGFWPGTVANGSGALGATAAAVPFPPIRPRTGAGSSATQSQAGLSASASVMGAASARRRSLGQVRAAFEAQRVPEFIKAAAYKRRDG